MSAVDYSSDIVVSSNFEPATKDRPRGELAATRLTQTIDIRQDRTWIVLAGGIVALVVVLFAGLFLGRFAKTETVRGFVGAAGGLSSFQAPKAGIVGAILVRQGDLVAAGQPLYTLKFAQATSGGETADATEARKLQLNRAGYETEIQRTDELLERIGKSRAGAVHDRDALAQSVDDQEKSIVAALKQAKQRIASLRNYVDKGYATRDVLETAERTRFEYERQLSDIRLKRVEYRRQDAQREREFDDLQHDRTNARNAAESQIGSIDIRLARLRTDSRLEVRAENAGRVLTLAAHEGDTVEAGQLIAAVGAPDAEQLIVLEAPSRAVGLARTGQRVNIKYDAFPFKTFGIHGGTIVSVSAAAIRNPDGKDSSALDPRPVERQSHYRIEVKPDAGFVDAYGEKQALKFGATLSADIIVEKRRIIDWVLDPIRAMRGRG